MFRGYSGSSASPQTSPKTVGAKRSYQTGLEGGGDHWVANRSIESTGSSQPHGELTQHSIPSRALGVHTILNPSETQSPLAQGRADNIDSTAKSPGFSSQSNPRVLPPFEHRNPGMTRREQTTPTTDDKQTTTSLSMDRPSPDAARSYPPIAAARQVLTPRSPRFTSPGQPPARAVTTPQFQPQRQLVGSQELGRVMASEAIGSRRPEQPFPRNSPLAQQFGTSASPTSRPPLHIPQLSRSTRSFPHSVPDHSSPSPQGHPFFPSGSGVQPGQQHEYSPHHSYGASTIPQTIGGYPGHGADPRWPGSNEHPLQYSSTGVRNLAFGEGQAALRIQPAHGEAFIVPVDTHQGSKQADEKRQRNAGASQRFRKRKKDRETQERVEHQRMEDQYRELKARIQALETDRERLRSDRDRLRDIVYRTPSISELAYQGPPSPVLSNSSGLSPRASRPSYGSADPETGERPSQRRRTDPQLEYTTATYSSSPGTLPPITGPGYASSISHPGTPSARTHIPQLPPLRLGSASGTPTTALSATNTPVQAYHHLKRDPYEAGWAAGPRSSVDPSQR
ncbi:hypothetical protein F4808DRAFT_450687 [Astrocystis sublimbata]|nr:hypothetical protein F4808DRAFT_450687 [Astrocystis sublimbata]